MKAEHAQDPEPEAEVFDFDEAVAAASLTFPPEKSRPCYGVYEKSITHGGKRYRPGTYYHSMTKGSEKELPAEINTWLGGPCHLVARTADEGDNEHGTLLEFINKAGNRRQWSMPDELLAGSGEDVRREVMSMGLPISYRNRADFNAYLQHRVPKKSVLATSRTGWVHGLRAFVLPGEVIGPDAAGVIFQNGGRTSAKAQVAGTVEEWKNNVARYAIGNPVVTFAVSVSFSAPLMERTHSEGGGVHLVDMSSSGKSTALELSRSAFGPPDFTRSWKSTGNGLEGVAAQHNDLPLPLDEISEVHPREAGVIAYMISNGVGKTRATKTGAAREPHRWRTLVLSTGERSLAATMQEAGIAAKAGQSIRLLDVPAKRQFGVFDNLHEHRDGRALSDAIKSRAKRFYGAAGRAFLERLTSDDRDFCELLAEAKALPAFSGHGGQEGRAAARFALIGLGGELATEYGVTGWPEGAAMNAAIEAFNLWRQPRGEGDDEPRKVCEAIRDFVDKHGGSRFIDMEACSDLGLAAERATRDRAGYYQRSFEGERIFLFNTPAFEEAIRGLDRNVAIEVLLNRGALEPTASGSRAGKPYQQRKIEGVTSHYYVIRPDRLGV